MTEQRQPEPFDDELLSAYVDGELAGAELAQVEQRLANDPQAKQLVDELRALSHQVQSLPQEAVGEDLRSAILQRAERAMLLGTAEQASMPPRNLSSARRWAWAVMALAACLLLTIYLPSTQQDEQPVAKVEWNGKQKPTQEATQESVDPESTMEDRIDFAKREGGFGGGGGREKLVEAPAEGAIRGELATRAADSVPLVASNEAIQLEAVVEEAEDDEVDFLTKMIGCQVRITSHDDANRVEHFSQVLAGQGINLSVQQPQNEVATAEGEGDVAARSAMSMQRSQLADSNRTTLNEKKTPDKTYFLVEASDEQIANILATCNADSRNWATVRLFAEPEETELPIAKWRQWERSGKQLEPSKQRLSKLDKQPVAEFQQGQAIQLDGDRIQEQIQALLLRRDNASRQFQQKVLTKSQSPVRVLFVLQQPTAETAAENGQPTAKP